MSSATRPTIPSRELRCHRLLGAPRTVRHGVAMGLNGHPFKLSYRSQPCPECLGYPPLVPRDGRLVPTCERCGGSGNVRRLIGASPPTHLCSRGAPAGLDDEHNVPGQPRPRARDRRQRQSRSHSSPRYLLSAPALAGGCDLPRQPGPLVHRSQRRDGPLGCVRVRRDAALLEVAAGLFDLDVADERRDDRLDLPSSL